jgi:hypothetical protein
VSIYPGTQTERDYRAGVDDGRRWAQQDLDAHAVTYWHETLRAECETFRALASGGTISRSARAYYVGALRGYREVIRTEREGKWST